MKRFLTVAVATVLASSLLVACTDNSASTGSASTGSDTQVETSTDGEGTTEAPAEEEQELDADTLLAELDKASENYAACADAAAAAGDEEAYAELGEKLKELINSITEKGDDLTQEDIDAAAAALKEVNDALEAYGVAVAEDATAALDTLNANIEAVDNYYAELGEYVDAAHDAGSLTDESYAEYKQYGNDLTSLGEAIGNALQADDTTIADVEDMNATLVEVYGELETMAESVGAEIATIELANAEAEAQDEVDAAALEEAEAEVEEGEEEAAAKAEEGEEEAADAAAEGEEATAQ